MTDRTLFVDRSLGGRERARLDNPIDLLEERLFRVATTESGETRNFSDLEHARALIKSLVFDDLDQDSFDPETADLESFESRTVSVPVKIGGDPRILKVLYWYDPVNEILVLRDCVQTLTN